MELNWLETFIALAESNSMRTAASNLGISPATASERIAALEYEIGTDLLKRTSKGSELTVAGKMYLESAKKLISNWDDMVTLVKPLDSTTFHHLSLGFPCNCMPPVVGKFLDGFILRHPEIEISLTTDVEIDVCDGLKSHDVDLFFVFEPSATARRDLTARPVHHTHLGVLVPSSHRLALKTSADLKDFDGDTFVLYPSSRYSSLKEFQINLLRSSGLRYIEYGGNFSPTLFQLTGTMGCGVVFCPRMLSKFLPPKCLFMELNDDSNCDIYMMEDPLNTNPAKALFLKEFGDQEGTDER